MMNTVILGKKDKCNLLLPAILLLAGILLAPVKSVSPSTDSFWYLNTALEMHKDLSLDALVVRRPLFSFLLSISYHVFGIGIEAGIYLVRIFFILNILLSYYAGKKMFNKKTGLLFSLLVITSYEINICSTTLLLDTILPFFFLSYILVMFTAIEKKSHDSFIFAGILLGLCIHLKGSMGLMYAFIPLGMLMYSDCRSKKHFLGLAETFITASLVLGPWLIKIARTDDTLHMLFGPVVKFFAGDIPFTSGSEYQRSIFSRVWGLGVSLFEAFDFYIFQKFIIFPVLITGAIYFIYLAAIKKNKQSGMILLSILPFIPILICSRRLVTLRSGQFVLLYFLLYLAAAVFLARSVQIFTACLDKIRKPKPSDRTADILNVVLIASVFLGQVFVKHSKMAPFRDLLPGGRGETFLLWLNDGMEVTGFLANEHVSSAGKWLMENSSDQDRVMCDNLYQGPLTFFTHQNLGVRQVRYIKITPGQSVKSPDRAVFIWPKRNNRNDVKNNYLVAMLEKDLFRQINGFKPRYFMIGERRNYLALYFAENECFNLRYSVDKGQVKIYEIEYPLKPLKDWETVYEDITFRHLSSQHKQFPEKYKACRQILNQRIDWDKKQQDAFYEIIEHGSFKDFENSYLLFKRSKLYNLHGK